MKSVSVTTGSSTKIANRRIAKTTPHAIVQGLQLSGAKDFREIRPRSPHTMAPNTGGVGQNRRHSTNNRLYLENGTR